MIIIVGILVIVCLCCSVFICFGTGLGVYFNQGDKKDVTTAPPRSKSANASANASANPSTTSTTSSPDKAKDSTQPAVEVGSNTRQESSKIRLPIYSPSKGIKFDISGGELIIENLASKQIKKIRYSEETLNDQLELNEKGSLFISTTLTRLGMTEEAKIPPWATKENGEFFGPYLLKLLDNGSLSVFDKDNKVIYEWKLDHGFKRGNPLNTSFTPSNHILTGQDIVCGGGNGLNSIQFEVDSSYNQRFNYSCVYSNLNSGEEVGKKTSSDKIANTFWYDRHNIDCGTGNILTSVGLKADKEATKDIVVRNIIFNEAIHVAKLDSFVHRLWIDQGKAGLKVDHNGESMTTMRLISTDGKTGNVHYYDKFVIEKFDSPGYRLKLSGGDAYESSHDELNKHTTLMFTGGSGQVLDGNKVHVIKVDGGKEYSLKMYDDKAREHKQYYGKETELAILKVNKIKKEYDVLNSTFFFDYKCKPAFDLRCRTLSTPVNDGGGGNIIYLNRHKIQCNEDEALSQYKQTRVGNNYKYDYTCCKKGDSGKDMSSTPAPTTAPVTRPRIYIPQSRSDEKSGLQEISGPSGPSRRGSGNTVKPNQSMSEFCENIKPYLKNTNWDGSKRYRVRLLLAKASIESMEKLNKMWTKELLVLVKQQICL
jgi:hypothetical protein